MRKFIAILSAAAVVFSLAACGKKEENVTTKPVAGEDAVTDSSYENILGASGEIENVTNADGEAVTEIVTEVVTDASGEKVTDASGEAVTEKITEVVTQEVVKVPKTKAEIIDYCNAALNKAKQEKAGYTKTAVMDPQSMPAGIAAIIAKDEVTTMAKGGNNINDFPAAGFEWSSKLREQDVQSATINVSGTTYDIMLKLGTEKNPAKGTASSYGRVMSVIDAADAKEMVSVVKSIDMLYHDGYVHVKVDSKTGKVIFAEFSATADITANIGFDLSVKDVKSTETFTNFVW